MVLIVLALIAMAGWIFAGKLGLNSCIPASAADEKVAALMREINKLDRDFEAIPHSGNIVRMRVNEWSPKRGHELLDVPDDQLGLCYKIGKYESLSYAFMMAASTDKDPGSEIDFADRSIDHSKRVKQLLSEAEGSNDPIVKETLDQHRKDDTQYRVEYLMAMDYCIKARAEHNPLWKTTVKQMLDGIPDRFKLEAPPNLNSDLKACI